MASPQTSLAFASAGSVLQLDRRASTSYCRRHRSCRNRIAVELLWQIFILACLTIPLHHGKDRLDFTLPHSSKPNSLSNYFTRYRTVELDGMRFRLPTLSPVTNWVDHTPDPFVFSVKGHRTITHVKRFNPQAEAMLEQIAPLAHKQKLGLILLQLRPNF